ncbi:hypothetical protein [Helicobacter fennelliae]|uniref:Uncharacterized protein n=2 Tax=Helicobacter fennelliae TaxID=215 RepID=T1D049_9HELI|nr:hypothetical protein [Helicobacter fennelliae]GAD19550.1 hypothetical protein HFN_0790 [Helicobacter fennelliae MRY12-0050]SQB98492.1 putative inner membrane protein [Helicobacter fennelliae]STP07855.1 putative inner membrane protein [Helicobacter fennelliae]STQ84260.1 putative inner membrane protein [Helicobacter fennelliae]
MYFSKKTKKTSREILQIFVFCLLYFLYAACYGVFLVLPPLLGTLFVVFSDVYEKRDTNAVIGVVLCLILFEAINQLPLGILPIMFLCVQCFVIKKFNIMFGYSVFFVFWYVGIVYFAYFLVIYIIKMFGSGLGFSLNFIFVYYWIVESILGLLYEKFQSRPKAL